MPSGGGDAKVIDGVYQGCDRIEAMAHYALARMPQRCALLGHSMGGRVALEIWRLAPERIARLALADTGIHAVKAGEREKRFVLHDTGVAHGDAALVDQWLPPMIGPNRRGDPDLVDMLRTMCVAAGTEVYRRQVEALLHRPDPHDLLSTIDCPTWLMVGSDDAWSPVSQHEEITALIPGARLRVIEGAGHMAPAEAPEAFNAAISEWLDYDGSFPEPELAARI